MALDGRILESKVRGALQIVAAVFNALARSTIVTALSLLAFAPSAFAAYILFLMNANPRLPETGMGLIVIPWICLLGTIVYVLSWNKLTKFPLPERFLLKFVGYAGFAWGTALAAYLVLLAGSTIVVNCHRIP